MKNIILFPLFIFFSFNTVFGQTISGDITYPVKKLYFQTIDTTQLSIWYDYSVLQNKNSEASRKSSQVVLQIGVNFVKTMDTKKKIVDSLYKTYTNLEVMTVKEMNEVFPLMIQTAFNMDVFYDISQNKYTVQKEVYTSHFKYNVDPESINQHQWVLKKEYKTIFGYKAQKATIDYGGRKWNAWFTNEIPLSYGPYVFGGLPGLIVEISDSENHHVFIIKGLSKKNEHIYIDKDPNIESTSQKEFMATEKRYYNRPDLFAIGNTRIPTKNKAIPYNPIEIN